MKSLVIAIILIAGVAQVSAVTYQTKYKGSMYNVQSPISYGAAAPAATFQSTSTYASPEWAEQPMLNSDGTVNEGAYMGGGPRRAKMDLVTEGGGINPPEEEDEIENGTPLGDAVLPLLMMSLAFCGYLYLRRKRSEA